MSDHDLLRWQFDLTWSLFEYHLERLTFEDFLWEPAGLVWTIRDGAPDFYRAWNCPGRPHSRGRTGQSATRWRGSTPS